MAPKKQASLGRGLGALIASGGASASKKKEEAPVAAPAARAPKPKDEGAATGFHSLLIAQIHSNPYQPRREFDLSALQSLKESIHSEGLLQPVAVRAQAEGYQLIAGERRLRACRELGWERIPARILEAPDATAATLALLENLQREDLNPVEEALGYASLLRDFGLTQEKIAARLGRKRSSVANTLRLLQLDQEIQGYLSRKLLSAGHAKVLLSLERSADQLWAARRAVERDLSVRDTQLLVERLSRQGLTKGKSTDADLVVSAPERAELEALQSRLSQRLGTSVQVRQGRQSGRIVLEYANRQALEALVVKLEGNQK